MDEPDLVHALKGSPGEWHRENLATVPSLLRRGGELG